MKQLQCEICGSKDLVKENGVFVCKNCGVKYSLEETRKMLLEEEEHVAEDTIFTNPPTDSLLRRAMLYLEDEDWEKATECLERVLDNNPECALGYVGKLMADLKCPTQERLKDCSESFENNSNFQKALRFGDEQLRNDLTATIDYIQTRNEEKRLAFIYSTATTQMERANDEDAYKRAASMFETIPGYKDADILARECEKKADIARQDKIYDSAVKLLSLDTIDSVKLAKEYFLSIKGWKDADNQAQACADRLLELEMILKEKELQRQEEHLKEKEYKRKKVLRCITGVAIGIVFLIVIVLVGPYFYNSIIYHNATSLYDKGEFTAAVEKFTLLGDFRDAKSRVEEAKDAEYQDLIKKLLTYEDFEYAAATIQEHCTKTGEPYQENPYFAYATARSLEDAEDAEELVEALELYEGVALNLFDSANRALSLRAELDQMVKKFEEHLYDDQTSLEELDEERLSLKGYDGFNDSFYSAFLTILEDIALIDDATDYFCCDYENYGVLTQVSETAFIFGITGGRVFSSYGPQADILHQLQVYAASCGSSVVEVDEELLNLARSKAPQKEIIASKPSGISDDTLKEGEYWCMGKNDTCKNKTYDPYDFYCNLCDPDGDNIEG